MIAATPPVLLWPARFLEAIRAERDAAANTLAAYQRDLDDYADFLTGRGLDYASAARAEIEDYIDPYGCVMAGDMAPVWARGRKPRR